MTNVHEAKTPDESRRLNTPGTPSIIVSASGMATGGRVIHHLESLLPHAKPRSTDGLEGLSVP